MRRECRSDRFSFTPAPKPRLDAGIRGGAEDELAAGTLPTFEQPQGLPGKRNPVLASILRVLGRNDPAISVYVLPYRPLCLADSLPGQ